MTNTSLNYKWIPWQQDAKLQLAPQTYIVRTESSYGPNNCHKVERVMLADVHYDEKGKVHWSVKNQTVTHYLKPISNDD